MTLERAGRWWPGREMAMLRKEAEAERWQRMTYGEKVAEQAAARREARERWRKGVGVWPRWQVRPPERRTWE